MAIMLLFLFVSAVLTLLFWATVVAVAVAILGLLWAIVQGIFWIVTRPIVWLVIMPLQFICGSNRAKSSANTQHSPHRTINSAAGSSNDKLQQLGKLKGLLDSGTVTPAEFEQLKADLFRQS
jgi:uncharacterized membrane protein